MSALFQPGIKERRLNKTQGSVIKKCPLSLRLLNKAEIALGTGAFFGMLAVACIVFLPMTAIVPSLVIVATVIAGLSTIAAVILLVVSSVVITPD